MSTYHIGVVKYYDNNRNFKGKIVSKRFGQNNNIERWFHKDDIIPSSYVPQRGDMVLYSINRTENNSVIIDVYRLCDAHQYGKYIPWSNEAFKYVGNNMAIRIDGNSNNQTCTIPVFKSLMSKASDYELARLLNELCDLIGTEHAIPQDVMEVIVDLYKAKKEEFLDKCETLQINFHDSFCKVFYNIVEKLIEVNDFCTISHILQDFKIDSEYLIKMIVDLNLLLKEDPVQAYKSIKALGLCMNEIIEVAQGSIDLYGELYLAFAAVSGSYPDIEGKRFLENDVNQPQASFYEEFDPTAICGILEHYSTILSRNIIDTLIISLLPKGPEIFRHLKDLDKRCPFEVLCNIAESNTELWTSLWPIIESNWESASEYYHLFPDSLKKSFIYILKREKLSPEFLIKTKFSEKLESDKFYESHPEIHLREDNLAQGYTIAQLVYLLKNKTIDGLSSGFISSVVNRTNTSSTISSADILKQINAEMDETESLIKLITLSLGDEAYGFINDKNHRAQLGSAVFSKILNSIISEEKDRVIDTILKKTIVFDIEGKIENKKALAWDIAYCRYDYPAISLIEPQKKAEKNDWDQLIDELNAPNNRIIAGHRIKKWDLELIKKSGSNKKIQERPQSVWDTLEIELLLSPRRKSYALNVKNGHKASNDVEATRGLFEQQVKKLLSSPTTLEEVEFFIPPFVYNKIQAFHKKFNNVLDEIYNSEKHDKYFYPEPTCNPLFKDEDIVQGKSLIIAPEELWPRVASQFKTVYFHYPNEEPIAWCNPLDHGRIRKELKDTENLLEKHLYLFVESRKGDEPIMYSELSEYVRHQPECQTFHEYILETDESTYVHCALLEQAMDLMHKHKYDNIYIAGSIYQGSKTKIISKAHLSKVYNIIDTDDYSPFKRILGTYSLNNTNLSRFYLVQDRPGDFSIVSELNIEALDKICASRNIKKFVSSKPVVDGITRKETGKSRLEISNRMGLAKYWSVQLKAFESIDSPYPKVLLVDNEDEAAIISQYYNVKWFDDVPKVLDQLRDGKQKLAVLSLDSIKNTETKFIDSWFSFVLCSRQLSFFLNSDIKEEKEKAEYLLVYYRHLIETKAYCDSFYLLETGVLPQDIDAESENHLLELLTNKLEVQEFDDMNRWIETNLLSGNQLREPQKDSLRLLYADGSRKSSSLTVLPTGYGKSVLFQGPALYKAIEQKSNALNIVISPLQALMVDQVESVTGVKGIMDYAEEILSKKDEGLKKLIKCDDNAISYKEREETIKNLPEDARKLFRLMIEYNESHSGAILKKIIANLEQAHTEDTDKFNKFERDKNKYYKFYGRVAYINASTTPAELRRIQQNLKSYRLTLLYIAPERLMINSFYKKFIEDVADNQGIDSIIFDEAHCITGWGMDFRPSYIHALNKILKLQRCHPSISIQLLTATMTHQAKIDLPESLKIQDDTIFPVGLYECNNKENDAIQLALCPIQKFISLHSYNVDQELEGKVNEKIFDKKVEIVSNYLLGLRNLVPSKSNRESLLSLIKDNKSRVIIFTYSRDEAEDGADKLKKLLENTEASDLSKHIDFYHAGLSKERKIDVASRFKSDDKDSIKILFSTKAFGMGIDIPNIHSVIHLTPPTYIEDYLQEVGRAGRNTQARKDAGFGEDNPIQAICLYSDADLKKNKDRVDCIRWEDIDDTYKKIYSYISDFKKEKNNQNWNVQENFFAIPTKLLECTDRSANNLSKSSDLEELFHKCLIWLSDPCKFDLVEVGFNCPNMYDIDVKKNDTQGLNPNSDLYKFLNRVSVGRTIIKANELLGDGRYSFHTVADIERMIDEGVRLGLLSKDYMYVSVSLNNRPLLEKDMAPYRAKDDGKKDSQQKRNIESIDDGGPILPIKAIFELIQYNRGDFNSYASSFNLFNEIKRIYPINDFIIRCYRLIKHLIEKEVNAPLTWNDIQKSIDTDTRDSIDSNTRDINLCKLVLIALNSLKVINFGNTITDFIEIKLKNHENISKKIKSIGDLDDWEEKKKSVDSFYSTQENKAGAMCRLIQLMDDSNAQSSKNIEDAKELLIEAYKKLNLKSKEEKVNTLSSQEIIKEHLRLYSLLTDDRIESSVLLKEEHFQAASTQLLESVGANQRDSKKQYKLDEDQVGIFNLKSDTNLNVLAGAGSGKTHLLSYWALKLILCERKSYRSILVLAYNRAVRDEVKKRIIKYASDVGYTIKPDELHVHTFHEFALINVDGIKDKPMSKWEEYLLIDVIKNPHKYHDGNQFDHIIVDEFQDITSTRLATLNLLASSGEGGERSSKVFFVGDKNQSIYGYQKKKDVHSLLSNPEILSLIQNDRISIDSLLVGNREDITADIENIQNKITQGYNLYYKTIIKPLLEKISIEPGDYYRKIECEPENRSLTNNYRSFKPIIRQSEEWLGGNVQMRSQRELWKNFKSVVDISSQKDVVKYISTDNFQKRVKQLCQLLNRDYSKEPLTVGVLFRTGNELFCFYDNLLQTWYPKHKDEYHINIQGSDISYDRTREFYFFCEALQAKQVDLTLGLITGVIKDMKTCQDSVYDNDILEIIERVSANIIDNLNDKEKTIGQFIQAIKESLSYDPIPFAAPGDTNVKKRMVLSVIHRVKGMEYDVVIVPSSNMPIDREYDNLSEQESVQEEKRIMYVAYSRAKSLLIFQHGDREKNLLEYPETQKLYFTGEDGSDYAEDGLSKINLGYLANKNDYKNKTCEYIQKNVKIGQKLTIVVKHVTNNKGESYKRYILKHDGYEIGCLSNDSRISKFLDKNICENSERTEYSGLKVKSVNIQTREQELRGHTILEIEQELEKIKTDEEKNTYLKDNKIYHYYYWKNYKSETFVYYVDYYGKLEESIVKR